MIILAGIPEPPTNGGKAFIPIPNVGEVCRNIPNGRFSGFYGNSLGAGIGLGKCRFGMALETQV